MTMTRREWAELAMKLSHDTPNRRALIADITKKHTPADAIKLADQIAGMAFLNAKRQ
ncbi:hypothetical protein IM511_12335 [Erythrobacteraceae bacterium E2-1 Yellow Sea]|nr:hypothetical protein [Erythrobacteraceae bacterium E2-1 Yellow Sea]